MNFCSRIGLVSTLAVCLVVCWGCSSRTSESAVTSLPPTDLAAESKSEPGFVPLHLAEMDIFLEKPAGKTPVWKEDGATIRSTGKPRGYLYTKRSYRNFTLRGDLYFPADSSEKANTGFLVYITGPHKRWPRCVEIQGKFVELCAIIGNGNPNPIHNVKVRDDKDARAKALRPFGEWNSIEVVSRDGKIRTLLNGVPIADSDAVELREGPIAVQAENHPYEIRNLRVRDDTK